MSGYKGFSSFHSESVEVLIRRAMRPRVPTSFPSPLVLRADSFALSDATRFFNHGAFGAPLRAALLEAQRWRDRCEAQPLQFMDRELLPALVDAVQILSSHYGIADATRLLPTQNATTALNAALRCATADDLVLLVRPGYASNLRIAEATGARVEAINISNGTRRRGADAVVAAFAEAWPRDAVAQSRGRVFVLLEHISSHDALRMPLEDVLACIRRDLMPRDAAERLVVVVDGAHAPGTIERLPLDDDASVFYAGNLHKWFLAPRGAAFLRVPAGALPAALRLHAPVASHGRGAGLLSEFVWDGNRDYAPWLSVPLVCDFWRAFGGEQRAMAHASRVADAVEAELCRRWSVAPYGGLNSGVPMRLIQVPRVGGRATTSSDAMALQDRLFARGLEVPIKSIDGELFMRGSFALYNTPEQYVVALATAIEAETRSI